MIEGAAEIYVGDLIRFDQLGNSIWWTVRARDDRFIIVTRPKPFTKREDRAVLYSVVDLTGWEGKRYNGAGDGPVRSSLNTLGGGYDLDGLDDAGLEKAGREILEELHAGRWELSLRRVINVRNIERKSA